MNIKANYAKALLLFLISLPGLPPVAPIPNKQSY